MQRKTLLCVLVASGCVVIAPSLVQGNSGGALPGFTGAPAVGGASCTTCHVGTVNSGPGGIQIAVADGTYAPGSVIPVTVSLAAPIQNPRNGYSMAAYALGGSQPLSGWTSPNTNESQIVSDHIGHASGGNMQSSWLTYFTTPSSPTSLTFYAAGNDTNGNGNTTGDLVYTTFQAMTPGVVPLSIMAVPKIGTTVPLSLNAPGDANKAYHLGASFGNSGVVWGGRTIPLSDDALLAATVANVWPTVFQDYVGYLGSQGTAAASLNVPNDALLIGLTIHHAFMVIDPGQPYNIGTISNGLAMTLF